MTQEEALNLMTNGGSELSSYEAMNLEENVENLVRAGRIDVKQAAILKRGIRVAKGDGMSGPRRNMGVNPTGYSAQFTLNITRSSANITSPVIVPLFGSAFLSSAYAGIITQPNDVALTKIDAGAINATDLTYANSVRFQYKKVSDPTKIDYVTITCSDIAYPALLAMTLNDSFIYNQIRYGISDSTKLTQFDQEFSLNVKTLFGKTESNKITVRASKSPFQFSNDAVDIQNALAIDKTKTIGLGMIASENFSVTLYGFIDLYNANTAESELKQKYVNLKGL